MIEHSPKFGKTIFLDKAYGSDDSATVVAATPVQKGKAVKGKTSDAKSSLKEMPEVTTLADAATVLTAEGALAADFDGTVDGAQKLAKSLGLAFPNLKNE